MYACEGQVTFFEYFQMHYSNVIRSTIFKDLRTFVCLGSPPGIFMTKSTRVHSPAFTSTGTHWECKFLAQLRHVDLYVYTLMYICGSLR